MTRTIDLAFMVRRLDTFGGMVVKAADHAAAAKKARRYRTMTDAPVLEVRRFCGPAGTSAPVLFPS